MKTNCMSDPTKTRSARKVMAIRDGVATSHRAVIAPDTVLRGRKSRRALRDTHVDATPLDLFVLDDAGTISRPTLVVAIDSYSRMITGWQVGL